MCPLGSAESLTEDRGQRQSSGGQPKSFTVAELCFSPREDLRGKFLNPKRRANTYGLLREPNLIATLLGFNFHGYHIARFSDVVIHVFVYQRRF